MSRVLVLDDFRQTGPCLEAAVESFLAFNRDFS